MSDAIVAIAAHVVETGYAGIPAGAVEATRTFILDSFGVGLAGSSGPLAGELVGAQSGGTEHGAARVWGQGARLPPSAAAMCNAYQIHNSEFDCIHEEAVVHVMAIVLPVALAGSERLGNVSGRRLTEAVILGADVAAGLGVAASSGLRFFRPATAGAFGGVAALGKLMGFPQDKLINAFSLVYGQLCGTMQAHTEGSMLLATQIGFNARNAVVACELAEAGFDGPKGLLDGDFGYYTLFEDGGDTKQLVSELGKIWRIQEVAHKPFPSGRATHGIIDGCLEIQRAHGLVADQIEQIRVRVPRLVHQLVGRPVKHGMTINYARLCAQYVTACALLRQGLALDDFSEAAYGDPARQALARRIELTAYDAANPNALTPINLEVTLADGTRHAHSLALVYGAPQKPLTREAHLEKYRSNCKLAACPVPEGKTEALIEAVDRLEAVEDVARLVDHLVP